tara:strand:+ start:1637 stop:1840 length:204 start_codon:yes stop_codon:yes gene_type:complete
MTTYKKLEQQVDASADYFQEMYLDWFNNFLTVEGFADWYGISEERAAVIISAGRKIHHQRVNERLTA